MSGAPATTFPFSTILVPLSNVIVLTLEPVFEIVPFSICNGAPSRAYSILKPAICAKRPVPSPAGPIGVILETAFSIIILNCAGAIGLTTETIFPKGEILKVVPTVISLPAAIMLLFLIPPPLASATFGIAAPKEGANACACCNKASAIKLPWLVSSPRTEFLRPSRSTSVLPITT